MKDIEILVKSLEILRWNWQVFDTLNWREQFSYYDKFKKIKLEDLKKNFASNDSGIWFAIKWFKEDISGDSKLYFTKSINIIMDYLKTEDTTWIETIWALMESPYFKHYLVIKIDTELTQLKTKPAPTPV
jgi:hypothetical protein